MKYNLIGKRFGRLVVIEETMERRVWNLREWTCLCDCGKIKSIITISLTRGATTSCGCYHSERLKKDKTTHGHAKDGKRSLEYRVWAGMKSRCYNPKVKCFHNYGGRGIKVCDRWLNSFENFLEDMGERPSVLHSLDRFPDENGNYEPSNCRWATIAEQARGKRYNKWYEHNGVKMVLEDWAKELNVSPETIKNRSDKEETSFSEQFEKLKMIGDRNREKGFIWERKKKIPKRFLKK